MKVIFYDEIELEELDVAIRDLPVFISLVRDYGYEDDEGNIYIFENARVEAKNKLFIYLTKEE